MKNMKIAIIAILLVLPAWSGETGFKPRTALTNCDGIVISVTAHTEATNRTRITCILTNQSKHVLATGVPISKSLCFRFTMRSRDGNTIPLENSWALSHGQPNENNTLPQVGLARSVIYIRPGKSRDFQFYLEDAYGERSKEGLELEVKWMNFYSMPGGGIEMDEIKHPDGTVIPAYREENHFSGVRSFVVKLPLTDDVPATVDEPPATTPKQAETKPVGTPPDQALQQVSVTSDSPTSFDRRWLALLLVPALLLLRRIFRTRKTHSITHSKNPE